MVARVHSEFAVEGKAMSAFMIDVGTAVSVLDEVGFATFNPRMETLIADDLAIETELVPNFALRRDVLVVRPSSAFVALLAEIKAHVAAQKRGAA